MTWKLFLDDERFPSDLYEDHTKWTIARNYHDAVWYVTNYGMPSVISFDHDLGSPSNMTGMDFAKWLCTYIMDCEVVLDSFEFYVHSQNPVGAKNIKSYLDQFMEIEGHK